MTPFWLQYYTPANQLAGANEQEQPHSNTHTQVWGRGGRWEVPDSPKFRRLPPVRRRMSWWMCILLRHWFLFAPSLYVAGTRRNNRFIHNQWSILPKYCSNWINYHMRSNLINEKDELEVLLVWFYRNTSKCQNFLKIH